MKKETNGGDANPAGASLVKGADLKGDLKTSSYPKHSAPVRKRFYAK